MIQIKSVWHLEKDGRTLYIDQPENKKESILVISSLSRFNGLLKSKLRATSHQIASSLSLKNCMILNEQASTGIGPFRISVDPAVESGGVVNIIIDDGPQNIYYYLSSAPMNNFQFEKDMTILLPAELSPNEPHEELKLNNIKNALNYSGIIKIIISGKFAKDWQKVVPKSIETEIIEHISQMEINFPTE